MSFFVTAVAGLVLQVVVLWEHVLKYAICRKTLVLAAGSRARFCFYKKVELNEYHNLKKFCPIKKFHCKNRYLIKRRKHRKTLALKLEISCCLQHSRGYIVENCFSICRKRICSKGIHLKRVYRQSNFRLLLAVKNSVACSSIETI